MEKALDFKAYGTEFNSCQNYELLFLARIGQVPVGSKQKLENSCKFSRKQSVNISKKT